MIFGDTPPPSGNPPSPWAMCPKGPDRCRCRPPRDPLRRLTMRESYGPCNRQPWAASDWASDMEDQYAYSAALLRHSAQQRIVLVSWMRVYRRTTRMGDKRGTRGRLQNT